MRARSSRGSAAPARAPQARGASLRQRLLQIIALHQSGHLEAATAGYRDVLRIDPRQFDAWRLLGAAQLAQRSADEALGAFDRALAIRSDLAEVWALRGDALAQLGRHDDAIASFERTLSINPGLPAAWSALGLQLQAAERYEASLHAYQRGLELDPNSVAIWANRGLALNALQRHEEALQSEQRALELAPQSAEIWCNHGKILNDLRRFEEAVTSLDRALQLAPDLASAWSSRAAPLRALGRLEEALASSARSVELDASSGKAWSQHGALLGELQRYREALGSLKRALQLAPCDEASRFNHGVLSLLLGDFTAGWEGYESREIIRKENSPGRVWDGQETLEGRTLLLICEQGLGDTIQFCRFAPLLASKAARVLLTVPPPLIGLARSLSGGVEVLTDGDQMPPIDLKCPLLSVPHRLGTTPATIPAGVPYLAAPAGALRKWHERLAAARTSPVSAPGRPRLGLVCSGNPDHGNDRHRSMPLRHLEALGGLGFELHLLQKLARSEDESWLAQLGVVDHRAEVQDFADTAALVSCMDIVVSVDTSVAHVAGALGKPLCVLLAANPDWRWMLEREDSPWYPTARLFRQSRLGHWDEPVRGLVQHLRDFRAGFQPGADHGGEDVVPTDAVPPDAPGVQETPAPSRSWWEDPRLIELEQQARATPYEPSSQFNLGLRCLTLGSFERGWDYYEWRQLIPHLFRPMPQGGTHWDGSQEIAGHTLLVCDEQGLGDIIQFCRFVPWASARGARVLLGARPPLKRLLQSLAGVSRTFDDGDELPTFDYKCLLLSLPHRFRADLQNLPATTPYLAPPSEVLAAWRRRLGPASRPRIGLVASGNPSHVNDARRSIAVSKFAALHALGVELHLLQTELRPNDAEALKTLGIVDHREHLVDMAETAALIACMDAVVSVDTAVAHLAGALGTPLYLLLTDDPDWRWMLGRDDSPWYPSARLFRQTKADDWSGPVARVVGALRLELATPSRARPFEPPGPPAFEHARVHGPLRRSAVVPPDMAAMLKAAIELHRSGRPGQAVGAYRQVLQYIPREVDALRLLGAALLAEDRAGEALEPLDAAIDVRDREHEVWALRAEAHARLQHHQQAAQDYRRAIALRPDKAELWNNEARSLQALGRIEAALDSFDQAVQRAPDNAAFRVNRALALLMLGRLPAGWQDFEWRTRVADLNMVLPGDVPVWDGGQPLERRTILLSCEQGLGDTIQFSRFARLLAQRGARVLLGVPASLRLLLATVPGVAQVVAEGEAMPDIDLQCWLLGLPHRLGTTLASIPAQVPYLSAPAERLHAWRERLDAGRGERRRRIGVACSGSAGHANDRDRSIGLESFARLCARDAEVHLVQKDLRPADEPWLARLGIVDHRAQLGDFADTAALLACMDAIVSVDTAVAHLAGALGRPLHLLLPTNADWRWMLERTDTPWYPTARLYRQASAGEWEPVLDRLVSDLAAAD